MTNPTAASLQHSAESILEHANTGLLVVDRTGQVTAANPVAERILEGSARPLLGRLLWDWFPSTPRDEVPIGRTLREGSRLRGIEAIVTRRDGTRIPVGISCSPLLDPGGRSLGAVVVFQDLTEIKHLQRRVFQTEKMASIGQLAAGVAHEINNPMGFIHANLAQMEEYLADLRRLWSAVEELRRNAGSGDLDAVRKSADRVEALARELDDEALLDDFAKAIQESQEGSERIRHIVQDLRAFAYEDREERTPADLNQCLDSTATIASATMKHAVALQKHYAELPAVRCNPMQLKQVFMNLLVNAYQAVMERIEHDGGQGEIVLRTRLARDGVEISVQDDGVGIHPDQMGRLFDPFFTTKAVGVGTGLGLYNSFHIVRRHGGTLLVRSQPGRGATFEVWLPLRSEHEVEPGA